MKTLASKQAAECIAIWASKQRASNCITEHSRRIDSECKFSKVSRANEHHCEEEISLHIRGTQLQKLQCATSSSSQLQTHYPSASI